MYENIGRYSLPPWVAVTPGAISRWRHWKRGKVSEHVTTNQRALERGLREKWGERLLSFLLPVANQIPHMAAIMPPGTTVISLDLKGEFLDLFGRR